MLKIEDYIFYRIFLEFLVKRKYFYGIIFFIGFNLFFYVVCVLKYDYLSNMVYYEFIYDI